MAFMIGHKTPWTPGRNWEHGKYKKLPVHNESSNKHIAFCINNGYLFNENCLLANHERLIITEGVTNCFSLMEHGFAAVSPITVRIRVADWERLLTRLRSVKIVYICQDNEISRTGLHGAFKTTSVLVGHKIQTKLVILPLDEHPEKEIKEAEELLFVTKIDVNDFFATGHTAADFEELIAEAKMSLEFDISRLPADMSEEERNRSLEPVLREVAQLVPLEQNRHLKLIQEHFGKSNLSFAVLRDQVRVLQKEKRAQVKQEKKREKRTPSFPAGPE